jgi:hypothetical protein
MNQVRFAGEDEDDAYSGFNDYNASLDTQVSSTEFEPPEVLCSNYLSVTLLIFNFITVFVT